VGPRPQILRVHDMYPPEFDIVLDKVRPGVTGVGSIVFRDEERLLTEAVDRDRCFKTEIVPYKAALEIWYAENARRDEHVAARAAPRCEYIYRGS